MARKKHYPIQRKMRLSAALPSVATDAGVFVDRELSRVNHRLYRQSRYYQCKVDIDADLPNGTVVNVYALADTWMNQKAYQFAHKVFLENSKQEREQLRSTASARWNDFRVGSGTSATGPVLDATIYDPAGTATRITAGEYLYSEVTDAAGTAQTFRWTGTGANTFNILDEYDNTGNTDAVPGQPVGANVAYDGLEDELDDNQMQHLSADGNSPPYDATNIENQCWYKVATLYVDADGGGKLSTGFFTAPCGFVTMTYGGGANQTVVNEKISLEVKAGDYKGVHAPSMLE